MNLTDTQKQQIAAWIRDGLQLPEVQKRIAAEFGVRPTYMEVKLLVSELEVLPKDTESPAPAAPSSTPGGSRTPGPSAPPSGTAGLGPGKGEPTPPGGPGSSEVKVEVDQFTRPGVVASGNVRFSDGKSAAWYIDDYGRLGLAPKEKGYRPSAADVHQFQQTLEEVLGRQGY